MKIVLQWGDEKKGDPVSNPHTLVRDTEDSLLQKWWWRLSDSSYNKLYKLAQELGSFTTPACYLCADLALGFCVQRGGVDFFRIDPVHANAIVNVREHTQKWVPEKVVEPTNDILFALYGQLPGEAVSWREISPYLKGQRLTFLTDPRANVRYLGKYL